MMMPWTQTTRVDHDRGDLRHASDCRDEEWKLITPIVTRPSKVGRPREVDMRRVWEAIQYIATTGCRWWQLPKDFPRFRPCVIISTACAMMGPLRLSASFRQSPAALSRAATAVRAPRSLTAKAPGRPKAAAYRGYDAGKKVKGRKRHITVDDDPLQDLSILSGQGRAVSRHRPGRQRRETPAVVGCQEEPPLPESPV